ncbi:metacaspase-1-like [Cynara cardunculus var. scolymus]|uniref:metacaspase-1-like n=1 Tax=Cynara cardunculus var. scolymus TaxID=59895 RepID=UPI000D62B564|nr:metacaspase-1-like [Cynara cardunculus var. scolymus]
MSSLDNVAKCSDLSSVSPEDQPICCPDCRDVFWVDGETPVQSSRDRGKLVCDTKGLNIRFKKMWQRRQLPDPNYFSSYEKLAIEMIRNWEPTKGKRALLCGVTYNKQKYKLKGTNYDVNSMRELLISRFQFPSTSIRTLAETDSHLLPTKRNIQEALRWLVKDNQKGDSLVFYFSGHGLRQPDFFDDERDGFDETICPLDFKTAGMIIDNEINETIVRPLVKGVKLHAIIDACHSGTILDLPLVFNTKKNEWSDNSPPSGVYKGTSGGHAISISACEDNQLAADTSAFSKQMEGAMTYTLRKAVEGNRRVTYASLLASMHKDILAAKATRFCLRRLCHRERQQEPLISSSKVFDLNEVFVL